MKKIVIEGYFGLDEQDPYEPIGIIYSDKPQVEWRNNDSEHYLAQKLHIHFDIEPTCDGKCEKKLKITIEEIQ